MDFYRGKDYHQQEDELKEIMEQAGNKDVPNNIWGHFRVLASRGFLRPFLCVGVIYTLFHLSGFNVINTYTHIFLEECEIINEMSSHYGILLTNLSYLLGSLGALYDSFTT